MSTMAASLVIGLVGLIACGAPQRASPLVRPSSSPPGESQDDATSAGPGPGGGHQHHGGSTAPPIPGAATIEVVAREYAFVTDRSAKRPRIVITQPTNIVFINEGTVAHEFDVAAVGFHLHAEVGETAKGGLKGLEPVFTGSRARSTGTTISGWWRPS